MVTLVKEFNEKEADCMRRMNEFMATVEVVDIKTVTLPDITLGRFEGAYYARFLVMYKEKIQPTYTVETNGVEVQLKDVLLLQEQNEQVRLLTEKLLSQDNPSDKDILQLKVQNKQLQKTALKIVSNGVPSAEDVTQLRKERDQLQRLTAKILNQDIPYLISDRGEEVYRIWHAQAKQEFKQIIGNKGQQYEVAPDKTNGIW